MQYATVVRQLVIDDECQIAVFPHFQRLICDVAGKCWGYSDGRNSRKNDAKKVKLKVLPSTQEFLQRERLGLRVTTIDLESANDPLKLLWVEEGLLFLCQLVGKVDQDHEANEPNDDSEDAFHDKDPSPAGLTSDSVHLHQSICKYLEK